MSHIRLNVYWLDVCCDCKEKQRFRELFSTEKKQTRKGCTLRGPVYSERERQCCDVASDTAPTKLLRFLNKPSESLQKWLATPIDHKQECIPVGCVPSAAVAVSPGGGLPQCMLGYQPPPGPGIPLGPGTPGYQAPPQTRHPPPRWTDRHL